MDQFWTDLGAEAQDADFLHRFLEAWDKVERFDQFVNEAFAIGEDESIRLALAARRNRIQDDASTGGSRQ